MNCLTKLFQQKLKSKEKILSIFVTAGYPHLDVTPRLASAVAEAGADMLEIGVPFSDPLADGPAIQRASRIALENGVTVKTILQQTAEIKKQIDAPLVLMSYLNPILNYGVRPFFQDAQMSGVDGLILPDCPPEEAIRFYALKEESAIGVNFLIAPNTPAERIRFIDSITRDFLYCVSTTGVTGAREKLPSGAVEFLSSVAKLARHPYLVGFGISTPQQAREISRCSHGVIIGSALVELIARCSTETEMLRAVSDFVHEVKNAIAGV